MCGIFGYIGYRSSSAALVFDALKKLEYRGYDSWGVATIPDKSKSGIFIKKKIGKIGNNNLGKLPAGKITIGHTRWATHGGVTEANAHPQSDCTGAIAVIHNGIFENYESIKKSLISEGHKFVSQTDTEVICHILEDFTKSMTLERAVAKVFKMMKGANAVVAIAHDENKIVAVRNGSPLVIGLGKNENFLSSDIPALLSFTKNVYFLEDNEMAILDERSVNVFNAITGKPKKITVSKIDWNLGNDSKGKYPTFMLKEIYEQPGIIKSIAGNDHSEILKMAALTKKAKGIYLVGCGSAYHASIAGSYLFSKVAKKHVGNAIGSEFGYHLDFLNKDSLVIAISQSGETMDILESVKKAKERGAKLASLVNVYGSSLFRISDYQMMIGAGVEKGVASTKALTGMISNLVLLSYASAGKTGEGQKVLIRASDSVKKILSPRSTKLIGMLTEKIRNAKDIYVIGRGLSYPAALEASLKIKEISYIHAEGLAAGELKHGPLALIEKGTPCIAFLPDDETYGANLAGAMEMRARGGFIIGISFKPHEVFDYYIPVTDAGPATIIPNIVVAQLIAYQLTIERGYDADKPRNLAKSVTVK